MQGPKIVVKFSRWPNRKKIKKEDKQTKPLPKSWHENVRE